MSSLEYTPILQDGFTHDLINSQIYEQFISGSGSITVNDGIASITSGINAYDYTLLRAREVIKWRTGFTTVIRFSAQFTTPVANSLQMCGVGTASNDVYIGYSGTDFVTRISKGGKHDIRILTITLGASGSETFTLILNSTTYSGTLTNTSIAFNINEIIEANTYTGYILQHINDTLIIRSTTVGLKSGTFSFSTDGSCVGTLTQDSVGASLTTTLVTSNNWNGNASAIRRLDPTEWNMYEIEYGWYGISNFVFRVFNEYTNIYDDLHIVRLTDSVNTGLGLTNPSMYVQRFVASIGSTSTLTINTSSVFVGLLGSVKQLYKPHYSIHNSMTVPSSTETNILVLTHRDIVNSTVSIDIIRILQVSIATNGTDSVVITMYLNPDSIGNNTTSDFLNYQYVNSNESMLLYDVTSTSVTGGIELAVYNISSNSNQTFYYGIKDITLSRSESIVITAMSASSNTVSIAVIVDEDI